jgi:hypothetical protein
LDSLYLETNTAGFKKCVETFTETSLSNWPHEDTVEQNG